MCLVVWEMEDLVGPNKTQVFLSSQRLKHVVLVKSESKGPNQFAPCSALEERNVRSPPKPSEKEDT